MVFLAFKDNVIKSSLVLAMPVYEYRCNSCHRKVSLFRHNFSLDAPACPYCGGELKRIFSTFAMHKTYKDVYDDILVEIVWTA